MSCLENSGSVPDIGSRSHPQATHLRGRGVAVTTVCPGFVKTPMTDVNPFPMPWLMSADDAARRILRAVARRQKVCNFPWQTTLLMNLTRWLPDWVLARTMRRHASATHAVLLL